MNEIRIKGLNCSPEEGEGFSGLDADLTGKKLIGIVAEAEESAILMLRILAGLHKPAEGEIFYSEDNIYALNDDDRSKLIRKNSYIFDTGGLVSNLSVIENISLPYDFLASEVDEEKKMAGIKELISMFGLDETILMKRPSMLNKSEIKLVNFIRAFLIDPEVVFIELPFARMNKSNEKTVVDLLLSRSVNKQKTHIFATQRYSKLLENADAVIAIKKGKALYFPRVDEQDPGFDYHGFFERQEIS